MVVQAEQETLRVYERQSRVSGGTALSACSLLDTATTASRLMIPDNTPGGRGDCDRMMHDIREKFNKLRVSSTLCVMFTYLKTSFMLSGLVTARCTLVQSAVLRSHVVCLSVRL